ncbi:hypothetical protein F4777DRAFT_548688 [Nemania sp. FL0916]|nr:hypothetical protein F4777DRAFT_548688 [Nemania sp. FL0916]
MADVDANGAEAPASASPPAPALKPVLPGLPTTWDAEAKAVSYSDSDAELRSCRPSHASSTHTKSSPSPSFSAESSESHSLSRCSSISSITSEYSAATSACESDSDDDEEFCPISILKKPKSNRRRRSQSQNGDEENNEDQETDEDDDDDSDSECEIIFERNVSFDDPLATDIVTGDPVAPSPLSRLQWTAQRARERLDRERELFGTDGAGLLRRPGSEVKSLEWVWNETGNESDEELRMLALRYLGNGNGGSGERDEEAEDEVVNEEDENKESTEEEEDNDDEEDNGDTTGSICLSPTDPEDKYENTDTITIKDEHEVPSREERGVVWKTVDTGIEYIVSKFLHTIVRFSLMEQQKQQQQ